MPPSVDRNISSKDANMRCKLWNKLLLLGSALLGGVGASAQYNPPATPAPYNPIALAEVTGAPRAAVQAGQNNYQTLSQNPYLGGVPAGRLSATPVALSLEDAVALDSSKISAGSWPRMSLPTRGDSAGKR